MKRKRSEGDDGKVRSGVGGSHSDSLLRPSAVTTSEPDSVQEEKQPSASSRRSSSRQTSQKPPARAFASSAPTITHEPPPHVLRLIQLLQDDVGNKEDAKSQQEVLLSRLWKEVAQLSTPVVWNVVGRLVYLLLSTTASGSRNEFTTRTRVANALQGIVAQEGARQGGSRDLWMTTTTTTIESTPTALKTEPSDVRKVPVKDGSSDSYTPSYQSLQLTDLQQHFDTILQQGQVLWSHREEDDRRGSSNGDDQEERILTLLDEQHPTQKKESTNSATTSASDFVERRVRLQRQLLVRRLGLSGMTRSGTGGLETCNLQDIVTDQDLLQLAASTANAPEKKQNASKDSQELRERIRRRVQQQQRSTTGGDDEDEEQQQPCVRVLLALQQAQDRQLGRSEDGIQRPQQDTSASSSSFFLMIATEFLYRMFDPSWTVRHGALLGMLAMIRGSASATRRHRRRQRMGEEDVTSSTATADALNHVLVWQEDVSARCLCVLALDRFSDYSGAVALSSATTDEKTTSTFKTARGGVVAPVRETAGQILSVLFPLLSTAQQRQTLDVLFRMAQYQCPSEPEGEDVWEVRHGAMAALKFIVVILISEGLYVTTSTVESVTAQRDPRCEWYATCMQEIAGVAIGMLSDKSDDVKSVAAQILVQFVQLEAFRDETDHVASSNVTLHLSQLPTVIWKAPKVLWSALEQIKDVSSCIVDLVALFASLVRRDCATTLQALGIVAPVNSHGSGQCLDANRDDTFVRDSVASSDVMQMLIRFLHSDFSSVHALTLQAIPAIVEPLSEVLSQTTEPKPSAITAFCELVKRVYKSAFFSDATTEGETADTDSADLCDGDQASTYGFFSDRLRETAWTSVVGAAAKFLHDAREGRNALELSLLSLYFGVKCGQPDEDRFRYLLRAADALADFLEQTGCLQDDGGMIDFSLNCFVRSPLCHQCEAACILSRSLSARLQVPDDFRTCLNESLQGSCFCLDVDTCIPALGSTKEDFVARVCHDAFLEGVSMIQTGKHSTSSAYSAVVELWEEALQAHGVSALSSAQKVVNVTSMRVEATLAGSILSGGLPSKITPIVRALMTSLKNESNGRRQVETCKYMSELLNLVGNNSSSPYAKARTKILQAISSQIASDKDLFLSDSPEAGAVAATRILQTVIASLPQDRTLDCFDTLWSMVEALCVPDPTTLEESSVMSSIKVLHAMSGGLVAGSPLTCHVLSTFVPKLVCLACRHVSQETRTVAVAAVSTLCVVDRSDVLSKVLPSATTYLQDQRVASVRLAVCELLRSVIENAGLALCSFVRFLLPVTMSLMTDSVAECSRIANSMFATLVRLAPLVPEGSDMLVSVGSDRSHGDSVIDHLVRGRPLPPYDLPKPISDALTNAGIQLRHYQEEGVAWLRFLQTVNLNGALCDSMGLGKTLQALISVALSHGDCSDSEEGQESRSLVVCPSSVVGHWIAEIDKFFPGRTIFRSLLLSSGASDWSSLPNCNIVVTSYATLRRDIERLSSINWRFCILDEGHLLKNPKTATAKASRRIRARHKLILTGTPVQNHVHELWATFDFLMPNFLGSSAFFSKYYAKPITKGHLPGASTAAMKEGEEKLKELHQQVLPFILRREKEQVLQELPPKNITIVRIPMSDLQSKIYTGFCEDAKVQKSLTELRNAVRDASHEEGNHQEAETLKSLGSDALKSLLFLRLLCTHPCLVSSDQDVIDGASPCYDLDASGKLVALKELLRDAGIYRDEMTGADNDSSLLYVNEETEESDVFESVFSSDVGDPLSGFSGGTPRDREGSKCLIFSQFTRSLDVVEEFLFRPHMPSLRYLRLDGRVPANKRSELVDSFNRDPSIKALLLTTRVGGLGLNLTGADTVLFLENDYNPFVDLQAMDRAHRYGQRKSVNVYKLVVKDSIDERILELQEKKMAVSDAIVTTDNSTMFSMGTDRLLDIFTTRGSQQASAENNDDRCYNLDALVERYSEDYASLTVDEFVRKLHQQPENASSAS